jgi:hypothetical protein
MKLLKFGGVLVHPGKIESVEARGGNLCSRVVLTLDSGRKLERELVRVPPNGSRRDAAEYELTVESLRASLEAEVAQVLQEIEEAMI